MPIILEPERLRQEIAMTSSLRYTAAIRQSRGYIVRLSQGYSNDSGYEHEDLRSNPQNLHEKPDRITCTPVTPALGKGREETETGGSQ